MTQKTNVGVIGCGNMGRHHIRHYSQMDNTQLVCLFDTDQERVSHYAKEFNATAYTSLEDFLNHPGLEAVNIAAPTSLHFTIGQQALSKGLHVLMEKPLAETVDQAKQLIALAEKNGLTLTVGHVERFNPAITTLDTLIANGKLGDIISVSSQRMSMFPAQIKDANVILDLAVHDLDIFNHLMKDRPQHIQGSAQRSLIKDRADSADIFLRYPKASGHIRVNWICPIKVRALQIIGTNGYAELNYMTPSLTYYPSHYELETDDFGSQIARFDNSVAEHIEIMPQDALRQELTQFIDAIQGKAPLNVTAEDGLHALEDALYLLQTQAM